MPKPASILFLGTSSGGGPTATRNCSSLAITYDNRACLVDCAEGTHRQLIKYGFKTSKIDTIFITHMHGDHILGLVPLLASFLSGVNNTPEDLARFRSRPPGNKPAIQIYSPPSLRLLIRQTLSLTSCILGRFYAVHELLKPGDGVTGCSEKEMHLNELAGRDIWLESEQEGKAETRAGFWTDVLQEKSMTKGWAVSAGEIDHRVTSLAYTLTFPRTHLALPSTHLSTLLANNLPASLLGPHLASGEAIVLPSGEGKLEHPGWERGFKIAVLGDTSDASGSREICEGADLLIHECTNAYIPSTASKPLPAPASGNAEPSIATPSAASSTTAPSDTAKSKHAKKKPSLASSSSPLEVTRTKAKARGHSTPLEAGSFAASIQAQHVLLNHFSPMFVHSGQMREIERQTLEAMNPSALASTPDVVSKRVVRCAEDGMRAELKADGELEICEHIP